MQERDEDLAQAYDEIDRLEQRNLKHIITHIATGVMMIIGLIILLKKK